MSAGWVEIKTGPTWIFLGFSRGLTTEEVDQLMRVSARPDRQVRREGLADALYARGGRTADQAVCLWQPRWVWKESRLAVGIDFAPQPGDAGEMTPEQVATEVAGAIERSATQLVCQLTAAGWDVRG
jgi:hypothetical protein